MHLTSKKITTKKLFNGNLSIPSFYIEDCIKNQQNLEINLEGSDSHYFIPLNIIQDSDNISPMAFPFKNGKGEYKLHYFDALKYSQESAGFTGEVRQKPSVNVKPSNIIKTPINEELLESISGVQLEIQSVINFLKLSYNRIEEIKKKSEDLNLF